MGQTTAHGTFVYMLNLQDTLTRTSSCYPPKNSLFWALTLRHMSITNTTTDKPPPSIHLPTLRHCLGGRCLGATDVPRFQRRGAYFGCRRILP